ncbi:MAG: phytoene/squalene synthase family protein [Gemmatimonadaceae bacterium]
MPVADALLCERIARTHARTFYLAALFLPPEKRRGAFSLYAFCRLADDTVDVARTTGGSRETRRRLDGYSRSLAAVYEGRATEPVFRELAWTAERFALPVAPLSELLEGVSRDLAECRYRTWTDLDAYCAGVASSVGEMCTYVFGVQRGPEMLQQAISHGRTLGTAMQLTNILRDVGEDARRGRCYLPEEDLAQFELTRSDVLDGSAVRRLPEWSGMMRVQVERARSLYIAARPGIALLQRDAQRCASACAVGYAGILDVIETNHFDSFTRRASLGWPARARVLMHCWLGGAPRSTVNSSGSVKNPSDERATAASPA